MSSTKIGIIALTMALGTQAHAKNPTEDATKKIMDLTEARNILETLPVSQSEIDFQNRLNRIKDILDQVTTKEKQDMLELAIRCADPAKAD